MNSLRWSSRYGKATVPMTVSDASGDSAVIAYLKGKPVIHHGRQYQVKTNGPVYREQLKLNAFWRTLIDQKNGVYYFDSALSPQMVWVNLNQIDLKSGSGVRAIKIEGNEALQGNVNRQQRHGACISASPAAATAIRRR